MLIDRYQIDTDTVLGKGGFGSVFHAHDVHTGEAVATKTIAVRGARLGSQDRDLKVYAARMSVTEQAVVLFCPRGKKAETRRRTEVDTRHKLT